MPKQFNPNGTKPRPIPVIFRMTAAENRSLRAKCAAHGDLPISELIRRAIAAYPVRPSVES